MTIERRPALFGYVLGDGKVEARRRCQVTGDLFIIRVDAQALIEWKEGKLIQEAMPQLSKDEREILMTGYTPAEWDGLFKGDDDEEDESDDAPGTDP